MRFQSGSKHKMWFTGRVVWFKSLQKIIDLWFFKLLIYMNLTQIIVYKHQDQQSFACLLIQKQSFHTCVAVLTPDSLTIKYFMTLCMFELFPFWMQWSHTNLSSRGSILSSHKPWVKVHLELLAGCYQFSMLTQVRQTGLQLFNIVPVCSLVETLRVHRALVRC